MRTVALLWLVLVPALPLAAQQSGIDQQLELLRPPGKPPLIRWQAKPGRTYFIQVSTQAEPLRKWHFTPFIEVGEGQSIDYEVPANAEMGFFRLKYTDDPIPYGLLPEDVDFDGDGFTNEEELLTFLTDPLEWDTDGDGLGDAEEAALGTDPNLADTDSDSLADGEEIAIGTNPMNPDSDGDGITDGGETDQSTDPKNPNDTPSAEWFIVTGGKPEGETYARSRTVTIPAGESRIVLVAVASEEFPDYTGGVLTDPDGNPYLYNDILTWNIQPTTGQSYSGNLNVNSRHDDWEIDAINQVAMQGFSPVHIESTGVYTAPENAPLTVQMQLSATNIHDGSLPSTVMVGVLPVEIVAVFGKGPGGFLGDQGMYSQQYLEQYLSTIQLAKNGDYWVVQGQNRIFGIKVAADETSLLNALATPGQTIIFDGHANFGFGPNFSNATHKSIGSFTNFGTGGATDIPRDYRGDGSEPDVLPFFQGQQLPSGPTELLEKLEAALGHMREEGWSYLEPTTAEIKGDTNNYVVTPLAPTLKFENSDNIGAGGVFTKKGTGFNNEWHFNQGDSKRLIVSAPGTDVPATLRYKTLFYNACSSGPHFIENFQHGEFIYTNRTCAVFTGTKIFVQELLKDKTTAEILNAMEAQNADGHDDKTTYEVKDF